MLLDPKIKRLIRLAYANGFGNLHQYSLKEIRHHLRQPKLKVAQASYQDYTLPEGIPLRSYAPAQDDNTAKPAIIFLSANAFFIDRLDASNDYCSLLANNLNMKVVYVAHRLPPEYPSPQYIDDTLSATKWIYANAQSLKIDKNKIGIWGESSGGNIAATCSHLLRQEGLDILKHQILFYPTVDMLNAFSSRETYAYGYMLDKTFIDWIEKRVLGPQHDKADPRVSPLLFPDFHRLPSTTLILAEHDPFHDEGLAYADKLQKAGVPVSLKKINGMVHGFMRYYGSISQAHEALDFACSNLKSALM